MILMISNSNFYFFGNVVELLIYFFCFYEELIIFYFLWLSKKGGKNVVFGRKKNEKIRYIYTGSWVE